MSTNKPSRLRTQVTVPHALSEAEMSEMWALFEPYYADIDPARFRADLLSKQFVIVARDAHAKVKGFTTVQEGLFDHGGRRCVFLFSGDTILHPSYWGAGVLQKALVRIAMQRRLRHLHRPMFWFAICKGYKTYLLGVRTFADFWPRHDQPTPPRIAAMIDQLARIKFPQAWRPEAGVFTFPTPVGRLRPHVAPLDASLLAHPDIAFFARANPEHERGDELACVGVVNAGMLFKAVLKLFRRKRRPARA